MEDLVLQNQQLLQEVKEKNKLIDFLRNENMDLKDQLLLLTGEDEDLLQQHYTMITSTIAVGDCDSSYTNFEMVVDLSNPPFTTTPIPKMIKEVNHFGKTVFIVHVQDHPSREQDMYEIIKELIPKLENANPSRILFHCHQGISRSPTMAIVWIAITQSISYEEAFLIAQSARPIIHPNKGFVHAAKTYIQERKK
jgi:hypothetical protein